MLQKDIQRQTECVCLFTMIYGDDLDRHTALSSLSIEHFDNQDTRNCFANILTAYKDNLKITKERACFTREMQDIAVEQKILSGNVFEKSIILPLVESKMLRDLENDTKIALAYLQNGNIQKWQEYITNAQSKSITGNKKGGVIEYAIAKELAIKRAEDARNPETIKNLYIPTGFDDFDKQFIGLPSTSLCVVAAYSKAGKTALTMSFNRACKHLPQLIFSTEVNAAGFVINMTAPEIGVNRGDILKGKTTDEEHERLVEYLRSEQSSINGKIVTFKNTNAVLAQIETWRKVETDLDKPCLVVIDYLNDLIDPKTGILRSDLPIADFVSKLKDLTINYNMTIVVLSQLTKDITKRKDKTPTDGDIHAGGSVNASADVTILLDNKDIFISSENKVESDFIDVSMIVHKFKNEASGNVFPLVFDLKKTAMFSPPYITVNGFGKARACAFNYITRDLKSPFEY